MTTVNLPPGKDASFATTINRASDLLDRIGFSVEAVSWLNPAPYCWSVHLRSKMCQSLFTNGKGTSRQACLASGFGEYLERLSTNYFFSDYYLEEWGSAKKTFLFYPDEKWFTAENKFKIPRHSTDGFELLNGDLLKFYNPDQELQFNHLCEHNSEGSERGICALPFSNLKTGRTVYFPVAILNNLYVSNGMAAGNSRTECYSQALSEIVERYVKNHVIANGIALPDIPTTILKGYPRIQSILDKLKKQHMAVMVKDCSLGGRFPVICVLLAHPSSGGAYAAFGASYRFEIAIERTLTELLQGRQLDQFTSFHPPVHELSLAADSFNLESHFIDSDGLLSWNMFKTKPDHPFTPWNFSGTSKKEYHLLRNLVTSCGYQIYAADYNQCGMTTCRVIIPGMSEIYPVDDLLWNNKNSGSTLQKELLHLSQMTADELNNVLETVEALNISDRCLVSEIIGVLFDQNSVWFSLSIGELKAMLFLAMGRYKPAYEWCNWCHEHGDLPQPRQRLFRLLYTLLGLILKGEEILSYDKGLKLYFEEKEICEAEGIIAGKSTFPGLTFADSWRELSTNYNNLLKLYQRLNQVKQQPLTWASSQRGEDAVA